MTDKEKLDKVVKLADAMYNSAQYLTTDASRLHKAMEEYHQFIIHEYFKEDSVSEELEEAADKYSQSIHSDYSNDMFDSHNIYDAVIYGANWQKQKMMKDATEVTVHIDAGNYPYISEIELYDYDKDIPLAKEGDKYKVVLIKEE